MQVQLMLNPTNPKYVNFGQEFLLKNLKKKKETDRRKKYVKNTNLLNHFHIDMIFVSTKLPDPIHETVFPILGFIAILCFRPNEGPVNKPPFNKSSCTFLI